MISQNVVHRVRRSTCALLRLDQPHEQVFPDGDASPAVRPGSTTYGTAFLVRPDLALTNRHMVEVVLQDYRQLGHMENWYLEFTHPKEGGGIHETFRRISQAFAIIDPSGQERLDVGFLSFTRPKDEGHFTVIGPVDFGRLDSIKVGVEVAICGFPLGNELLVTSPTIWRFGPLIHQGIISGVSPFEGGNPRNLTSFLTDINTAAGMSGSPVFMIEGGKVIGLHFAGAEGTLGCALPVDQTRVDGWMAYYDLAMSSNPPSAAIEVRGGGDVILK